MAEFVEFIKENEGVRRPEGNIVILRM